MKQTVDCLWLSGNFAVFFLSLAVTMELSLSVSKREKLKPSPVQTCWPHGQAVGLHHGEPRKGEQKPRVRARGCKMAYVVKFSHLGVKKDEPEPVTLGEEKEEKERETNLVRYVVYHWLLIIGESSLKSQAGGLTFTLIFFFNRNTWWVKVVFQWRTMFFIQKCHKELVGKTGGQTLHHVKLLYFSPI